MQALKYLTPARQRCADTPEVLAEVLHDGVNLAVWQRSLSAPVAAFVEALLARGMPLAESLSIEMNEGKTEVARPPLVTEYADLPGYTAFVADVGWLLQAYACLLDAQRIGLRLRLLDQAMCPRFHVDRVPLRLVTTYAGPGSQWLAGEYAAGAHLADPALNPEEAAIRTMGCGDVALLKGERWEGNEHTAIIHRSPPVRPGERRLLLTLDWLA